MEAGEEAIFEAEVDKSIFSVASALLSALLRNLRTEKLRRRRVRKWHILLLPITLILLILLLLQIHYHDLHRGDVNCDYDHREGDFPPSSYPEYLLY